MLPLSGTKKNVGCRYFVHPSLYPKAAAGVAYGRRGNKSSVWATVILVCLLHEL